MRRVHGYRSEQRVKLAFAVVVHERHRRVIEFVDAEDANSLLCQFRPQSLVPAGILFFDELVRRFFDQFPLLHHSETVGSSGVVAVFELLQQAADPDLKEFVQVAGRDGQKFHAFEQRIAEVSSLFEHAPIEFQPRGFAVKKGGAIAQSLPNHICGLLRVEVCVADDPSFPASDPNQYTKRAGTQWFRAARTALSAAAHFPRGEKLWTLFHSQLVDLLDGYFDFLHHVRGQRRVTELVCHLLAVGHHPFQKIGEDLSLLGVLGLFGNQKPGKA